jgi:hypothetical protein
MNKSQKCGICRFYKPNAYLNPNINISLCGTCDFDGHFTNPDYECKNGKWQPRYTLLQLHPKLHKVLVFLFGKRIEH